MILFGWIKPLIYLTYHVSKIYKLVWDPVYLPFPNKDHVAPAWYRSTMYFSRLDLLGPLGEELFSAYSRTLWDLTGLRWGVKLKLASGDTWFLCCWLLGVSWAGWTNGVLGVRDGGISSLVSSTGTSGVRARQRDWRQLVERKRSANYCYQYIY